MLRNFLGLVGLILFVLMVTVSCSGQGNESGDYSPESFYETSYQETGKKPSLKVYRLGSGDQIEIIVYNEQGLSGKRTLDGQGMVDLPLVQEVSLGGLTASQAADKIESLYAQGYLQDPEITISILKYRPFYILGEVRDSGRYAFQEKLTIIEAVALAGGFTYRAERDEIEVIRKTAQGPQKIYLGKNAVIMPGDVIKIHERFF